MTTADWNEVKTLTDAGIRETDNVFTARSNAYSDFLSSASGTVAAKATSASPGGNIHKISERLIQDYPAGDKRKENNFVQGTTWTGNPDRGNTFNTRWALVDGGTLQPGVIVYSDKQDGATEHFIAGTWEENDLMKAEAILYSGTGSILSATTSIDKIRTVQGARLPAIGAVSLAEAKEEIRKERRLDLFSGVSFYDAADGR